MNSYSNIGRVKEANAIAYIVKSKKANPVKKICPY
jgi:hypothetical protein